MNSINIIHLYFFFEKKKIYTNIYKSFDPTLRRNSYSYRSNALRELCVLQLYANSMLNSMLFLKTKMRGNKVYLIERGVLLPGRPKAALT